ncbi:MAG TPA: proline racemase family protein [Nocardioidaceae bacterium]|nr:proline racemase family protein [Nocardioidaceae bacterium]
MGSSIEVTATDYHTAGEPFRIVTSGGPTVEGTSVRDRRETARRSKEIDAVRRLLCHEPRGHADMYGCYLVPPDDGDADLGVLFWHKDGYSTACGHGTIALGVWAVETGRVEAKPDGPTDVVIDVPSGRVIARVTCRSGEVERVAFGSVPSYVLARDVPVAATCGDLLVDVSYGGAIYSSVRASDAGLAVTPECYTELIALGREIKAALEGTDAARHPEDPRLSGIYGTILYDDLGETVDGIRQRNVTVFADGQVDRSPCGSGTAARLALLVADGRVGEERVLTHDSIVGTTFRGRVVGETTAAGRPAVLPEVEGMAYRTGEHRFVLDPRDVVGTGFVLR